jgi:Spy/CpxP family protein refolding chaperone
VKKLLLVLLIALSVPSAVLAQQGAQRPGVPPRGQRGALLNRVQMERQIVQRFARRMGTDLNLQAPASGQLEQILWSGTAQRREFAQQAMQLQRRLNQAVRNTATTDTEYETLLKEVNELRQREHDHWLRQEQELAKLLTPKQRALLTLRLQQLQQQIREIAENRLGGPPRTPQ